MFCGKCGAKIDGAERFCPVCGALVGDSGPINTVARPVARPASRAATARPVAVKQRGNGKLIAILAAIVAVVVILAVVIFRFLVYPNTGYRANLKEAAEAYEDCDPQALLEALFTGTTIEDVYEDYTRSDWNNLTDAMEEMHDELEDLEDNVGEISSSMTIKDAKRLRGDDFEDYADDLERYSCYHSGSIDKIVEFSLYIEGGTENAGGYLKIPGVLAVKTDDGWSFNFEYLDLSVFNIDEDDYEDLDTKEIVEDILNNALDGYISIW